MSLHDFAHDLVQEVLVEASLEGAETTTTDAFTRLLIEQLTEAGEFDDGTVCFHAAHGLEVSGYSISSDGLTLDLFISEFRQGPIAAKVNKGDVETHFKRLVSFATRCGTGYHRDLEEASPVFDMALDVEKALTEAERVRCYLFTNATATVKTHPPTDLAGRAVSFHIWDLPRLHRLASSGVMHEPIVVDFEERYGKSLPCLSTPTTDSDYSVLLAIVPGDILSDLYGEYGPRLLELNVRSFLLAKGAVNRGIRETLLRSPERFLAYNNGISATASKVETWTAADGSCQIRRLHDLQIVNGGQTTASIHHAVTRDGADADKVFVQAKVTVVSPEKLEEIVPAISKYSNTQNKVTTADFSSNDPFHVELEKLSRAVWAPTAGGGAQETRWFYERARGQYADALNREKTPAKRKAFKTLHPLRQKITKTDLAKFENTWNQLPHLVSRGAEKNFREFMLRLDELGRPRVDLAYFQRVVAKAILFRGTERIVSAQDFGGYRANIVAYTIARLALGTERAVDLGRIWREQALSPALEEAVAALSHRVQHVITHPPRQANIGEWSKRPECWAAVSELDWSVPSGLEAELLDVRNAAEPDPNTRVVSTEDEVLISQVLTVPAETWFSLSHWSKETGALQPWQNAIAYSLGRLCARGKAPSVKQARQGVKLLQEAQRLGFRA